MATGVGFLALIATMSCGHAETTTRQSISARSVTESPARVGAGSHRDVHEQVDRLRDLDPVEAELGHRPPEVLLARRMPALDPEAGVALGVAGGAQHVVNARRVVGLE